MSNKLQWVTMKNSHYSTARAGPVLYKASNDRLYIREDRVLRFPQIIYVSSKELAIGAAEKHNMENC